MVEGKDPAHPEKQLSSEPGKIMPDPLHSQWLGEIEPILFTVKICGTGGARSPAKGTKKTD